MILSLPFQKDSPSIMSKSDVKQPLLTGFAVINALVPVSLGQHQLIIRNKGTEKTTSVFRYFSPEGRGRDRIFCVYVAIGLRLQKVKSFLHTLKLTQCD